MNRKLFIAFGFAALGAWPADTDAQGQTRARGPQPGRAFAYSFSEEDPDRAVIGVTISTGSARDTLGVMVSSLQAGGPAEKAGIEEGNRIASINGVNLRLVAADTGDWEMSSVMSRRLTRELGKVKAGDNVDLRVYGGGQTRNVRVKTVAYDSLYPASRRRRVDADERAALGVSIGPAGSKRDTLGVFVMSVDEDGPAAKAGIIEGYRISAINSVDLRVSREDAGDEMISGVKAQRLHRELERLKPGDEVELRVYGEGRTRTVKLKTVPMSSLSHHSMFFGGHGPTIVAPRMAPMPPLPPVEGVLWRRHISRVTM